ncbi:MAG: tRNA uridine-5-carboxymethylaminomethyl(34) synthesis enzyme MnmG [Oscillospiraceae bacterium]|nr:tRNA uridine-5-carboxymethylaminomethyl(34) synthesis enzyme MnmG [Oscillospiraceae bacterium]
MADNNSIFDIAVVGGGHAGIEAALAAARMGLRAVIFAMHLDAVGNLPCNPAIGGSAKSHLVREIDALGGEMAKIADQCVITARMLNVGKGPAVHALRAQVDRRQYMAIVKHTLESTPNVTLKQGEIVDIIVEHGQVAGVVTALGRTYTVQKVILCTGTYLKSRIITGENARESGPDGLHNANALADCLQRLGLPLQRFKTGTPPRVNANTVDFTAMERQPDEPNLPAFSYQNEATRSPKACCYVTHTNQQTHDILRQNLHRSPMYSGEIEGVGARYCPSVEDKIVRFADKERHPVFVEPMGLDTDELYLQGLSSSMPEDVQELVLQSILGLENAVMTRPAYAIEYECFDPTCLLPSLECRQVRGLYAAGQICGTSGYEEAAALGLAAGVNAALAVQGKAPVTLDRAGSYLGILIDDLVHKGTNEPYRMLTSRAEYRLLLRQDNADQRLTHIGHAVGLISGERLQAVQAKYAAAAAEQKRLETTHVAPSEALNALLAAIDAPPKTTGIRLADLLKRPGITYQMLAAVDTERPQDILPVIAEQVEIAVKYEGYLKRQQAQIEAFRQMEDVKLPEDLDYMALGGVRWEARQKLAAAKPLTLGQASRLSGVNPADITALMVYLAR